MRKTIAFFFIIYFILNSSAQTNPRIATLPFQAMGVSESDAQVISSLFETALVQTKNFTVIEQNQIKDILAAQAFTLSGCTDESCAVELGKLLSAEQIVLGSFSSIGGKYVINAKIVNVESGENIRAEKVEADSLTDIIRNVEMLAYKLAGLTIQTEDQGVVIAKEFGEAFVKTEPAGAAIFINGIEKGTSPELISMIPVGITLIEARKGDLYGKILQEVGADVVRVTITLEKLLGNLFIKSSVADIEVFVDGISLGKLQTGFFENISAGNHILEMKGVDLYWKDNFTITEGQSTKVEAHPYGLGGFSFLLPVGCSVTMTGGNFEKELSGNSGMFPSVPEGKYTIVVEGKDYEGIEEEIQITKGEIYNYSPHVKHTEKYLFDTRPIMEDELYKKLVALENSILSDPYLLEGDLGKLEQYFADASNEGYFFPELEQQFTGWKQKWETARLVFDRQRKKHEIELGIIKLEQNYTYLQNKLTNEQQSKKNKKILSGILYGIGGIGAVGLGIAYWQSSEAYIQYSSAIDSPTAVSLWPNVEIWDALFVSSICVSGAGLISGVIVDLIPIKSTGLEAEIETVRSNIDELQMKLSEFNE